MEVISLSLSSFVPSSLAFRSSRGRINLPPPMQDPRRFSPNPQTLVIRARRSCIEVRGVSYRAPGTQNYLLNDVNLSFPERSLGLIFGQSGSGKTTLLQLLSGLSKPTTGSIFIQRYGSDGNATQPPELLSPDRVGIVFQFPERHFLADTILDEVTFGWPKQKADFALREQLVVKLQIAFKAVGLDTISLEENPHSLSGGFKRRLALAIQLVETPDLLLLDEPLAGLDWKARNDVVKLLGKLKEEVTLLVVSHDLKCIYEHCTDMIELYKSLTLEKSKHEIQADCMTNANT